MSLTEMFAVSFDMLSKTVEKLCVEACCNLPDDVASALRLAYSRETNAAARSVYEQLLKNNELAKERQRPYCQDTGMAVVFIDIGNRVFVDCDLTEAVNKGVRDAYCDGFLRKSVLTPLTRVNTGDNTPAVLHITTHLGSDMEITVAPKGFGSENMSRIAMLKPSMGIAAVEDFVVETVRIAGANPCPPGVVGVGIGGTFESVALLAKKQLLRRIGDKNPNEMLADMEERLLLRINALDIGAMGYGGQTSMLAVHVGEMHTHLAGLPVAVNIQCHACRHATAVLKGGDEQ